MAQNQEKVEIQVQCGDCRGTGLYSGYAEPKGLAVICLTCKGECAVTLTYIPYTGRQLRDDIAVVRESKGKYVFSSGPTGETMTYPEFLNKVKPAEIIG